MTKDKAIAELKALQDKPSPDIEETHMKADRILCDLLISLDCRDVITEWQKIDKWYT